MHITCFQLHGTEYPLLLFLRFLPEGDISFPLSFRVHLNEAKYHRSPFRARATILYSTFYELEIPAPLLQASDQN